LVTSELSANQLITTAAFSVFLNGRTFYASIGTKNTTITRFGFDEFFAVGTFVKKLTGIGRHYFRFAEPTIRAFYN